MAEHVLEKGKVHHKWDRSLPPAIEIAPGDVVHCETAEVTSDQITPGCDASALTNLNFDLLYPLAGPIYVQGAEPGDILEVEILRMQTLDWGWTGIIPGLGLLAEDFTSPYIRHFDLTNGETAPLREDIHIPIQPFCGTMGVALDEDTPRDVLPAGRGAGNIDTRHLNVGAKLHLPVLVPGGMFSAGDCHATQGDGEITGNGTEISMDVTFTAWIHRKQQPISWPPAEDETWLMAAGNARPLDQALQHATTELMRWLAEDYTLDYRATSLLMGQCLRYDVGNVFDPAYTMVAKVEKKLVAPFKRPA